MVSVLVPVRNEERCIGVCLESILAQDYPPEKLEILVMDGNSTDATGSIVRNFATTTGRIRCINNPGQLASAESWNPQEASSSEWMLMERPRRIMSRVW